MDIRSIKISGSFTEQLEFSTAGSGKEGLLAPVSMHGNLHGILVCLSAATLFTRTERMIIRHFAAAFAVLIDNHEIFTSQTEQKDIAAGHRLAKHLFSTQLPLFAPVINGWDIAQKTSYTEEHNGDFHDYISLPGNRLMIIAGKASGRGVGAAIFLTRLRAMISCIIETGTNPADLLNKLSQKISGESGNELFASMTAILVKSGERNIVTAIAGNCLPLINRPRSGFVEIPSLNSGVPLGLFNQGVEPYQNQNIQLLPGDGILIYTEGVNEIPYKGKQNLNIEELKQILEKFPEQDAEAVLQSLSDELMPVGSSFMSGDDCTLIYAKTE
jgi:serine phosphatase RsbU (regulator of sigma subunit)